MKKGIILFFTFFLLLVNNVSAHSVLESTNPKDGEVVKSDLSKVVLTFESKIEEGSKLLLVSETGESIPVSMGVKENELVANLNQPLEAGNYSVLWETASTDGHILTGTFSFEVADQSDATSEETSEDNVDDQEKDTTVSDNQVKESSSNSYFIYGIIGLLVIALIVSIRFIRKK